MSSSSNPSKLYSCQLCTKRKVKCDKRDPCSYCIRCGQACTRPDANLPRPRKKRFAEAELLARLKRYEEALKSYGADLDRINSEKTSATRDTKSPRTVSTTADSPAPPKENNHFPSESRRIDLAGVRWPRAQDDVCRSSQENRDLSADHGLCSCERIKTHLALLPMRTMMKMTILTELLSGKPGRRFLSMTEALCC